jgi:hypothetical protein
LHECIRPLNGAELGAVMGISTQASSLGERPRLGYWVGSVRTRREGRTSTSSHPLADLGGQLDFLRVFTRPELDYLVAVDEVELGESKNAITVERRLERQVEASERLDGGELGHALRHLHATVSRSVSSVDAGALAEFEASLRARTNLCFTEPLRNVQLFDQRGTSSAPVPTLEPIRHIIQHMTATIDIERRY